MSKFQNSFTTPEQSRRLVKIGVPVDSADCYYDKDEVDIDERPYVYVIPDGKVFTEYTKDFYIPCWSVGRLLNIIALCTYRNTPEYFDGYVDTLIEVIESRSEFGGIDFSKLDD